MLGVKTVIYHVSDLPRAKEWYARAFGVQPYFDEPFYVGFNIAGFELGLDPDTSASSPGNSVVAYWGVKDIAAEYERLLALGATKKGEIKDVGEGLMVAEVTDPFGNVLGLIQHPSP